MPQYVNSPFQSPVLLQKGLAAYVFGSYNYHQGNTIINVSQVALASNVATITGQIVAGEVPAVGSLVSVQQTVTGSGEFNVQRATVTAVNFNSNGFGTLSYALTGANVGATADFGQAVVEVPEVGETIVNNSFSIPVVIQAPDGDSQFTVPIAVTVPLSTVTAVTVTLQVALHNINSEYTNTTTVVTVAASAYSKGPVVEATLERGYYYRLAVTGLTGTGTIVAKIGG